MPSLFFFPGNLKKRPVCIVLLVFLLAGALVSTLRWLPQESRSGGSAFGDYMESPRLATAASRGAQWLIENRHEIQNLYHQKIFFNWLYANAANGELASQFNAILEELDRELSRVPLPRDLDDTRYLSWGMLEPPMLRLQYYRKNDPEYIRAVSQIQKLLAGNEEQFWAQFDTTDLGRLAAYVLLGKLGIQTTPAYESYLSDFRSLPVPPEANGAKVFRKDEYLRYMYLVTHIIFKATDFGTRSLSASDFLFESKALKKGLRHYLSFQWDDSHADIVSEILWSYKHLQMPLDDDAKAALDRLVNLQNKDGSWGKRNGAPYPNPHLTFVATMALLEFAEEPRTPEVTF